MEKTLKGMEISMGFEGLEYDYEDMEGSLEKDTLEQVEELERLKEQYMTEELERLLAIGDKEVMDKAISESDSVEKLQYWREQLLGEISEDDPDAKELMMSRGRKKL